MPCTIFKYFIYLSMLCTRKINISHSILIKTLLIFSFDASISNLCAKIMPIFCGKLNSVLVILKIAILLEHLIWMWLPCVTFTWNFSRIKVQSNSEVKTYICINLLYLWVLECTFHHVEYDGLFIILLKREVIRWEKLYNTFEKE